MVDTIPNGYWKVYL